MRYSKEAYVSTRRFDALNIVLNDQNSRDSKAWFHRITFSFSYT